MCPLDADLLNCFGLLQVVVGYSVLPLLIAVQ